MKLLVTGGAGFIGLNFVKYWAKNHPDDSIMIYDALTYAAWKNDVYKLIETNPKIRLVVCNICNPTLLSHCVGLCDTIVHFAAESHVDNSIKNAAPFIQSNIVGTYTLLEAVKKLNKRMHHISTDEVFGALELASPQKFTETSPYNPRSPYSASKASSDHLVRAYYHTFNCRVTISNCSNNYGPYQYREKFLPLAISNLLKDKPVPIYGDGQYVRDWVFVEDHCRAIEAILLNGQIGETYLVGGEEISNLNLIKKILTILNKPETLLTYVKDRPGHDRRYAVDYSKIQKELNWSPKINLNTGLQETINWYKNYII